MAKPAKDASVFAHIEALVAEEHRLFERGEPSDESHCPHDSVFAAIQAAYACMKP